MLIIKVSFQHICDSYYESMKCDLECLIYLPHLRVYSQQGSLPGLCGGAEEVPGRHPEAAGHP